MPARQPFDERHLQDVVLAQSGQIRASRRFSVLGVVTRPVVVLAAVVAIVAIALGVKDYVERDENSPAGPDTPTVEQMRAITHPKKGSSGKTDRTRMSATDRTAAAQAAAAANEIEKPLFSGQSSDARSTRALVIENRPNPLTAQAGRDEQEAADRGNGAPNPRDAAKPGSPTCLPLPNGTQPEDVDAPYYFGWATEYCGRDLTPTTPAK